MRAGYRKGSVNRPLHLLVSFPIVHAQSYCAFFVYALYSASLGRAAANFARRRRSALTRPARPRSSPPAAHRRNQLLLFFFCYVRRSFPRFGAALRLQPPSQSLALEPSCNDSTACRFRRSMRCAQVPRTPRAEIAWTFCTSRRGTRVGVTREYRAVRRSSRRS